MEPVREDSGDGKVYDMGDLHEKLGEIIHSLCVKDTFEDGLKNARYPLLIIGGDALSDKEYNSYLQFVLCKCQEHRNGEIVKFDDKTKEEIVTKLLWVYDWLSCRDERFRNK